MSKRSPNRCAVRLHRLRDVPVVKQSASPVAAKRDGYTDAHRQQWPEQTYPSDLTDAEWALVEDVFEPPPCFAEAVWLK